jgi:hypothetical protein
MTDLKPPKKPPPALSIVIVTLGNLRDLAVPLPGIVNQTIADRIELIVVARTGLVGEEECRAIQGLHSVRLVEREEIANRGRDATSGIAAATAPFVALHENHTCAEPGTFERLLAAFRPGDAAVAPVIYPANGEMAWGNAMYAVAHAHAAMPNDADDKSSLVMHSAVFRTDLVKPLGERLRAEAPVQAELVAAGYTLRYAPGTVMWHVNEARPARVAGDCFALGRDFGFGRSRGMGAGERVARAALLPAIAAMNVLRCLRNMRRAATNRRTALAAAPTTAVAALAFAAGEVRGYFDRRSAWNNTHEMHEFHVRGRLNGRPAAARWLAEAVASLPEGAP